MRWSFPIARVFDIQIRIHATFFFLLGAVVYFVYVPGETPNFWPVVLVLAVFVCVLLHELAHSLVARAFGGTVDAITLLPIGGVASMRNMPTRPIEEILISLSGPAVNAALAGIVYLATGPLQWSRSLQGSRMTLDGPVDIVIALGPINLLIALFNLLPAFPMDGGRVLRGLAAIRLPMVRATQIAATLGEIAAVAMILLGFYVDIVWLAIIGIFLLIGAAGEEMASEVGAVFGDMKIKRIMRTEFDLLREDDTLVRALDVLCRTGQSVFPVVDSGGHFLGAIDQRKLLEEVKRHGTAERLYAVAERDAAYADPEDKIANVFATMNQNNRDGVVVLEDGILVGIAMREEIVRTFRVNRAIQQAPAGRGGQKKLDVGKL